MALKTTREFGRKLVYDPDAQDIGCIKEQHRSYGFLFDTVPNPNTVLDVGANRGYFAAYALSRGAKHVFSFEPEPTNIALFKRNAPEATLFEGAVGLKEGEATFYVAQGSNKGIHSLTPRRGREQITVKVFDFWECVKNLAPDVIKIDIEDAEYMLKLDKKKFPKSVKALAIEFGIRDAVKPDVRQKILDCRWDEEVKANKFFVTYQAIASQFPVVGHDSTHGLTKLNWGAVYSGKRA